MSMCLKKFLGHAPREWSWRERERKRGRKGEDGEIRVEERGGEVGHGE